MVGPNKILTVSYGTFSCTLEGFDDPFSTMKAIAEYFRDLASEDRFFGAEPPTPDVQMLHAIAQKNSAKPVDAELADDGLHLKQTETPAEAETAKTETVEVETADTPTPEAELSDDMPAEDVQTLAEDAPEEEATVDEVSVEEVTVEELAQDDAAPVAEAEEEAAPETAELAPIPATIVMEDLAAEDTSEAGTDTAAEDAALEEVVRITAAPAGFEAPTAEADPDMAAVADIEEYQDTDENLFADLPDPQDHPLDDVPSFAKAVLRDTDEDSAEVEAEAEATQPEEMDEDIAALFQVQETIPDQSPAEDALAQAEILPPQADPDAEPTGIAAKLKRIRNVVAASVSNISVGKDDTAEDAPQSDDLTDDPDYSAAMMEEDAEFHDAPDFDAPAEVQDVQDDIQDMAEPVEETPVNGRRSVALGLSDEDLIAAAAMARPRNAPRPKAFERTLEVENASLSDEAEAELLKDLAAIDGDSDPQPELDEAAARAEAEADARRAKAQETLGDGNADASDETVERLLSQTNSKLKEDHTQRRQSALAHLKAAVAATIADRVGPNDSDEEPAADREAAEDYRKDLASIVRPRALEMPAHDPQEEEAPAAVAAPEIEPLVLVPQARVEPQPEPADILAPVRPRRVNRSAQAEETREQATGFADYAEARGANELHELLEAAAAYLNKVEGKPHFSRPEVMHMIMRHDRDRNFSREAQLRGFGDLLRNGTIEKVNRGQFVISSDSRFVANG